MPALHLLRRKTMRLAHAPAIHIPLFTRIVFGWSQMSMLKPFPGIAKTRALFYSQLLDLIDRPQTYLSVVRGSKSIKAHKSNARSFALYIYKFCLICIHAGIYAESEQRELSHIQQQVIMRAGARLY